MLTILTDPNPSLRERSRALSVEEITTPEFQKFLDALIVTMMKDGVGIAAPQVGKNVRAIVVLMPKGPECFINPEITKKSEGMVDSEEGCLSVPGKFGIVSRHKKVTIKAVNRHGRRIEFEAKNFPAIIFQHEIDHLDGILFIDKATKIVKAAKTKI
ncbi:peptide deformylase [Candidatus Uhrbacteria bacterium]|nr:peptide deformylase [Candidatus Uhrbacteria bacterium]